MNGFVSFLPSSIHSTNIYSSFAMPGTVLGPGDIMVNKPNLVAALVEHSV